jgi:hypothetical protein
MNVSLICACKNRYEPLVVSLASWLLCPEIKELIIVDWDSDKSLSHLTNLDSRIKIVTVSDEQYFNQPQPLNLAASIATGDYILKVDTDYLFNPYYSFFETYSIDDNSFLSGNHDIEVFDFFDGQNYIIDPTKMSFPDMVRYVNSYSPIFKYLKGLVFVSRENFWKIGGYNENLGKYYAYEDDEICHRLELLGLQHHKIKFNYGLLHLPHPDKKRYENFEGNEGGWVEEIKQRLSSSYDDEDTLTWESEYAVAQTHIDRNRAEHPFGDEYFIPRKVQWNITQMDSQHYYAEKVSGQKLKNFPNGFFMSLEESTDRQENIRKQFGEYDVKIQSLISKRFSESDDKISGKYVHQLNGGTAGCAVSHIKAIKRWYESTNEDYGFFCEDDISLEPVQYWNFTWSDFVKSLPNDWEAVQLLTIRSDFESFCIRERYWNDWGATAYIIKREYAKKLLDLYLKEDTYHLEIPDAEVMPLVESILFLPGKTYVVPLFVEETEFDSTFSKEQDDDVNVGQKRDHYLASQTVLEWWKTKGKETSLGELMGSLVIETKSKSEIKIETNRTDIEELLYQYSLDTENPKKNFDVGMWYWNQGHTAPALSYFLRCAERCDEDENLLAYEALIMGHFCYEKQGTRDTTARTLLQHALCLLPHRPEAYLLLAKFHSKRQQWQDCYIYSSQGLLLAQKDLEPLEIDVEYPGEYALVFEKAMSAYWWGRGQETRRLLRKLKDDYELNSQYYELVKTNLMQLGSGDIPDKIIKYQKHKHNYLRYKFPGSENIEKNYSQAYQDMFILSLLNGKRNGLYLEIGAQEPFYQNNTALLETQFDWKGISIEIEENLCNMFAEQRKNIIVCEDATTIDYAELLSEFTDQTDFDYLQVDCEPSKTTFEVLISIPFEKYRFAIITYEHDHYVDMTGSYREKSRRFLHAMGYEMCVNDISPNDESPFEDWWYHPDLIDPEMLKIMKCGGNCVNNVVTYMLPNFILPS